MEKEPQPESMATVTIKPDYPPSEYCSSEPPPAYHKPKSTAVQITKIVAVTVVLTSVILGSFLLASAYVSANANWRQLEQELELLGETSEKLHGPLQPEALIQEEPVQSKQTETVTEEPVKTEEVKEIETNNVDNDSDSSDSSETSEEDEEKTVTHGHFPMDLEELAGALLEKNQKTKMNCVVEKKRAEEVVDHRPKTITLPFGLNITTDPRFEKLSGERMVIVCESGTFQRTQPKEQEKSEEDENQEDDTILIQPVMIPIPHTNFQTHMPQQMPPMMQANSEMRPPMRFPMRPPMNPMETMRPPVPQMMHIQIQAQPQAQPQVQSQQRAPEFPPNQVLHHIVQQIIAQKIMEAQKIRDEQARREQLQREQPQPTPLQLQDIESNNVPQHRFLFPQAMTHNRYPIPEEILTQLNRLPNRDVIVAVAESDSDSDSDEESSEEMGNSQENRPEIRPEMRPQMRPVPRPLPLSMRPIMREIPVPQVMGHPLQTVVVKQIPQDVRPITHEMRPVQQMEMRPVQQMEGRPVQQMEERPVQQMEIVPQEIRIFPGRMTPPPPEVREREETEEVHAPQMRMIPQQPRETPEMRFVQEQRQNAAEVNGRQTYGQAVPIPLAMVQQQTEQETQEHQAAASEESRPHFVQPRSVHSVELMDS